MKFRTDFVTNSSSSSFILSYEDDSKLTINDVYEVMLDLFKTYLSELKLAVDYCEKHPKFAIGVKDGEMYTKDGEYEFKGENDKARKILRDITGHDYFSIHDYNDKDLEWIEKCPTYDDYVKYWVEKMYEKEEKNERGYTVHAPFSICDYTKETMDCLHYRAYDYVNGEFVDRESQVIDVDKKDLVEWYFLCADYYDCECDKKKCKFLDPKEYYYEMDEEDCEKIHECKKENIPFEDLQIKLLGRFAILSESGYIPEPIVEKLRKKCEYSCNHMG